jgi:hypothetical protein
MVYTYRPGEWKPELGDYLGDLTDEVPDNGIIEFVTGGPKNRILHYVVVVQEYSLLFVIVSDVTPSIVFVLTPLWPTAGFLLHFEEGIHVIGRVLTLCRTCSDNHQQTPCQHNDEERSLTGTWVADELKKALEKGYGHHSGQPLASCFILRKVFT